MDERLELILEGNDDRPSDSSNLRTVVIHRGERGYGFTVSGESPVIVQDVKDGGPAAQAGVRKGDSIIEVNGAIVSQINHKEVVQIIKSANQCVKLTLQSCPEGEPLTPQDGSHRHLPHTTNPSRYNDRITAPLPVNTQLQNQMEANKSKMLTKYLEKQRRVRDSIMQELQRGPSKVMQRNLEKELDSINRQIAKIQEELKTVKDSEAQSASSVSEPGSRPPSHYRARSSPDPLGLQSSHGFQSGSDSVNDVSVTGSCGSRGKVSSATFCDDTISTTTSIHEPPGTPPPPYASTSQLCLSDEVDENNISIPDDVVSPPCTVVPSPSQPILSMEDEEFSDTETLEDHGPFQSLSKLWNHNAYLAVFMNYVISNCDPSSLFFYVITHLYKEGVGKDMKRWAYEITSSFLLPGAPLRLCNVEENILHEIDETLQNELDKEEILRKVFWKARMRCREDLNEQLADFRNKRSAGLGSIFGPADHLLEESKYNKAKELQIVEHLLVPCLESVSDDLKNATDQMLVTVSSLATILLKYYMVRSQQAQQLIDRCPLYVSKERPLRTKIFRGNKKQVFRDHHFNQHTYYSVTYCNHCGLIIWGIAPQGYQCANCEMNIHKSCAKQVEEVCIGQLHKKDRSRDTRFSAILGKIISDDKETKRKVSQVNAAHIDKARKGFEEGNTDQCGLASETDNYTGEKGSNTGAGGAGVAGLSNHASSPASTTSPATTNHAQSTAHPGLASASASDLHNNGSDAHEEYGSPDPASPGLGPPDPSPPVKHHKKKEGQVNRSESLKEKQPRRKRTRENRKHSDPNIPTSKSGDVDADSNLIPDNSGSSSNSSLSPSLESPSASLEHVSREAPLPAPVLENDSDIECEVDLPNWQKLVSSDEIKKLKPKERKRQDTVSELFHTERTHVRVLKVLKHLFQVPMSEAGLLSKQQLDLLFPNLDEILDIHVKFNQAMKHRRKEEPIVSRVGDVLISMFDGEQGDHFQQQAAEFVRSQITALENLKQQQKRDQRLANFLQEQENNPVCRRLQLKDMLPCVVQRLSKYPLLIEQLLGYTDSSAQPEEYEQLSRSLERSKEILAFVNTAVQEAENSQRLHELQRKLDQSSLAKNKHGHLEELKGHLELTKHRLIYEGQLTWRVAKGQKNIDLQVLMLDEFIVLLQKADDKYILKNHSISKSPVKDENKLTHSPIIKYGPSMLFRAVATDNCAFFIVTTQTVGPHIYELVASSPMERKVWFRHIQEAQEAYTAREGRNRRTHPHTPLQDPDDSTPTSSDALRDVDDGVEVDGGEAADTTAESLVDSKIQPQQGAAKSLGSSGRIEELPAPAIPAQPPASPETLLKKTAEAGGSGSSGSGQGSPSPTAGRSPASGRRLQEVQIIQIVEGPTLIQPSEVKVSQGVVLSAEPVLTPIELLRRKDLKIRQALEEKQQIIANILNIPYEDFESVVDMAGEPAVGNKEPKELVLAAMFQAKCLQESLNEALNLTEGDIVAARANEGKATGTPLYQAPMTKLMNISTTLSQQLSSLLNLVSERDDERERMRKELVASRERLHLLHMRQNSASNQTVAASSQTPSSSTQPTTSSPYTSRPSSFVSVTSSVADHSDTSLQHDTDEDGTEVSKGIGIQQEARPSDTREELLPENLEDTGSRSEFTDTKPKDAEDSEGLQENEEGARGNEEVSAT